MVPISLRMVPHCARCKRRKVVDFVLPDEVERLLLLCRWKTGVCLPCVDELAEKGRDVGVGQVPASLVLLDHQPQRVEGTPRTAGVAGGDGARVAGGDRAGLDELFRRYRAVAYRVAYRLLGNEADAYEAAQEALIAAWTQLPSLRDPERFDAWLNRTLVNKCRDALRKRRRTREIDLSGQALTVPDAAEGSATQATVLAAFERLSISERHILALRHVQDLPLNEIAVQLGIPLGTAKSRLWSARRALERALEAEA